jgi:ATP-dependent DNA helicase RecG
MTQRWCKAAQAALTRLPPSGRMDRPGLKAREGWPDWARGLAGAHAARAGAAGLAHPARQRLAYDELFAHQLTLSLPASAHPARQGVVTRHRPGRCGPRCWPPALCADRRAGSRGGEIAADMARPPADEPAAAGRCGAGKTLVAFQALLIAVEAGGQGVMMAPTEILARQHFEGLAPWPESGGVRLELLTGRDKGADGGESWKIWRWGGFPFWSAPMRCFRKTWNSRTCGLRWSTNSTALAWRSGWSWGPRARRPMCW